MYKLLFLHQISQNFHMFIETIAKSIKEDKK